eukprot:803508-Rhodomonas_salina.1
MAGPRSKSRVAYLHDPDVGSFYYGPSHPMKPHRMQLAHQLILGYELHNKMVCYVSLLVSRLHSSICPSPLPVSSGPCAVDCERRF